MPVLGEYKYFIQCYKYKCNTNNLLKDVLSLLIVGLQFNENEDTFFYLFLLTLSGRYSKIGMAYLEIQATMHATKKLEHSGEGGRCQDSITSKVGHTLVDFYVHTF